MVDYWPSLGSKRWSIGTRRARFLPPARVSPARALYLYPALGPLATQAKNELVYILRNCSLEFVAQAHETVCFGTNIHLSLQQREGQEKQTQVLPT